MVRKENDTFCKIFRGKSGRYYSGSECAVGLVPKEENLQETNMVYDGQTKAMYYQVRCGAKVSFKTPYLSKNGRYCRFINGKIVENGGSVST